MCTSVGSIIILQHVGRCSGFTSVTKVVSCDGRKLFLHSGLVMTNHGIWVLDFYKGVLSKSHKVYHKGMGVSTTRIVRRGIINPTGTFEKQVNNKPNTSSLLLSAS